MAGRGRGKPTTSFNTEQLGLAKGELLAPVLYPPPTYPMLDLQPSNFELTNELEYLVELKRGFAESMRDSIYYLQPDEPKKDIERYSDRYRDTSREKSVREIDKCDWSKMPEELAPSPVRKKTVNNAKAKNRKKAMTEIKKKKKPRVIRDDSDDDNGNQQSTEMKPEEQRSQQTQNNTDKEIKEIKEEEEENEEDSEKEAEEYEEVDEEMDYGTDYLNNYFDNGEGLDDDDDNLDDGPIY